MINKNRNRQTELLDRFWKTAPKGDNGEKLMSMLSHVMYPKSRSQKNIRTNTKVPFTVLTIGDISTPHDTNTAFVNLVNNETNKVLMTYYERKISYDANGSRKTPSEYILRVGPCRYNYPNGQLAALELYDDVFNIHECYGKIVDPCLYDNSGNRLDTFNILDESGKPMNIGETLRDSHGNIVPAEQYDRVTSIYFDTKGKEITRDEFDVIYRKELEKAGLDMIDGKAFEYAPRIKQYNSLVHDLFYETATDIGRFSAANIREIILADKPDSYLNMIAEDIKKLDKYTNNEFPKYNANEKYQANLESRIRLLVYGEIEYTTKDVENEVNKYYKRFNIDTSKVKKENDKNGNTHEIIGDPDNHSHCITRDKTGRKIEERFTIKKFWGHDNIGPAFEYYPNGKVARITDYGYSSGFKAPSLPETDYHIDNQGRLTSFQIASKQCEEAWTKCWDKDKKTKITLTQKKKTGIKY